MEFFDLSFETMQMMRSFIVNYLRSNRIKVPQKSWTAMRPEYQQAVRTFDNYLLYVPFCWTENFGHVPTFLLQAFKYFEKNDLFKVEGIFRRAGSNQILADIEANMDLSAATIFDVTDLVKTFFRLLKEPLLTTVYYDSFLCAIQHEDPEFAIASILLLCLLLPLEHLYTLRYLTLFLAKVASYSDKNRMTARNLADVLTSSIIHQGSRYHPSDVTNTTKNLTAEITIIEKLIYNAVHVGVVPQVLLDAFHNQLFFHKNKTCLSKEIIRHLPCI